MYLNCPCMAPIPGMESEIKQKRFMFFFSCNIAVYVQIKGSVNCLKLAAQLLYNEDMLFVRHSTFLFIE